MDVAKEITVQPKLTLICILPWKSNNYLTECAEQIMSNQNSIKSKEHQKTKPSNKIFLSNISQNALFLQKNSTNSWKNYRGKEESHSEAFCKQVFYFQNFLVSVLNNPKYQKCNFLQLSFRYSVILRCLMDFPILRNNSQNLIFSLWL